MGALKVWDGSAWQNVAGQGKPGSVFVGPSTPPGTPTSGDMWYDTDEVAGLTLPLTLANGGTGGTSAPTARTSLATPFIGNSTVVVGAPTSGTYVRGDHWLDSSNVLWVCTVGGSPGTWISASSGEELAYNQITTTVNITATTPASAQTIVAGTPRSYDGSPILIQFNAPSILIPAGAVNVFTLWDGATDLGYLGSIQAPTGSLIYDTTSAFRRVIPTVGTHAYSIAAWMSGAGTGQYQAGPGAPSGYGPVFIRVTRI